MKIISTLEMLEQIKVGQYAKCVDERESDFGVYRNKKGIFWFCGKGNQKNVGKKEVELTGQFIYEYKWILEEMVSKVSFMVAMKNYLEGKTVRGISKTSLKNIREYNIHSGDGLIVGRERMLEGDWYVVHG